MTGVCDDARVIGPEDDTAEPPGWRPAVGFGPVVVAGALLGAAYLPRPVLAGACFLAQAALTAGWLRGRAVTLPWSVPAVALGASAAADGLLLRDRGPAATVLAAVLAVAFLVGLLLPLLDRRRSRVAEVLSVTVGLAVLDVTGALYVALRAGHDGQRAAVAALAGAGVALLAARLVDAVVDLAVVGQAVPVAGRRGLPGLVAGLGAAGAAGALYGAATRPLTPLAGLGVALTAGLLALLAEVAVTAAFDVPAGAAPRRWAAAAVCWTMPVLVAATPAYAVARAVLG